MEMGKYCFHGRITSGRTYPEIAECHAFLIKPLFHKNKIAGLGLEHAQLWHPGSKKTTT